MELFKTGLYKKSPSPRLLKTMYCSAFEIAVSCIIKARYKKTLFLKSIKVKLPPPEVDLLIPERYACVI